ncbi:hypothetical protein [Sedimenticola hydrogenitrophicus]|uniref:hypothetical protein n=1 Tax=Sedimenticola hydrogenitrophicus TaxID=2967975 RepID=UPI0023B01233|nr:hypothetical protein [Sedimenticola hydrogenitrophicus]
MMIYGWDDTGTARGEIVAGRIPASDLDFGLDHVAAALGWEKAFSSFQKASTELVIQMRKEGTGTELIDTVRQIKASYVPIVVDEVGDKS